MSNWDEFFRFAKRVADNFDLDTEERRYKLADSARIADTLQLIEADSPEWPESLKKNIYATNLLNSFFVMSFVDDCRDHSSQVRSAILDLLVAEDPVAEFDNFRLALRPLNQQKYTPGNTASLAAMLLMATDPTRYTPYLTETVQKFWQLVGWPEVRRNAPQAERYASFLDSLDEVLVQAPQHGLELRDRLDAQGLVWATLKYRPHDSWQEAEKDEFLGWRGEKTAVTEIEPTERGSGESAATEDAAWFVMRPGLNGEPSAIDGQSLTWTAEAARDLHDRIVVAKAADYKSFEQLLEAQLQGASTPVRLLAVELVYLHCLPLSNWKTETKLRRVTNVLSWVPGNFQLPTEMRTGLEQPGVFNGAQGFNILVWRQIRWMCRFIETWAKASDSARSTALMDPWAFRIFAASVLEDVPSIRFIFEYFAWPGFFEPIAQMKDKRLIRDAFADTIGGPTGSDEEATDKDLHAIRKMHTGADGEWFSWYDSQYAVMWRAQNDAGRRAWLIRQNQNGIAHLQNWLDEGFVSVAAKHLGSPLPGSSAAEIREAVAAGYGHMDYSARVQIAAEYYAFLTQMKPEDVIITSAENNIFAGYIADDAYYADDQSSRARRPVAWGSEGIPASDIDPTIHAVMEKPGTVVDITAVLTEAQQLVADVVVGPGGGEETAAPSPRKASEQPVLRKPSQEFADELLMPSDDLEQIVSLLQAKGQIVLYGPPGTGKTYLAEKLAEYLAGTGNQSRVRTVQFHPSYSYEDFFEGYRPTEGENGQVSFALRSGPLKQLVTDALTEGNWDQPFFLVIDEMNRGNLPKIFGELYFLLEYRNKSVQLQYSPAEGFFLPKNVFIIGTMNTADRSIAMVDAAIRRRFGFVELHPSVEPTKSLLRRYLTADGSDQSRAELLDALNAAIGIKNRDLMIGPSYLMQPHAAHPDGLQQIWKYELLPLLEEYFYDQMDRESIHRTYGLAALESRLRKERTDEEELPALGVARVAEGPAAAGGASHSQSS